MRQFLANRAPPPNARRVAVSLAFVAIVLPTSTVPPLELVGGAGPSIVRSGAVSSFLGPARVLRPQAAASTDDDRPAISMRGAIHSGSNPVVAAVSVGTWPEAPAHGSGKKKVFVTNFA